MANAWKLEQAWMHFRNSKYCKLYYIVKYWNISRNKLLKINCTARMIYWKEHFYCFLFTKLEPYFLANITLLKMKNICHCQQMKTKEKTNHNLFSIFSIPLMSLYGWNKDTNLVTKANYLCSVMFLLHYC